jgi:hypothetical protein
MRRLWSKERWDACKVATLYPAQHHLHLFIKCYYVHSLIFNAAPRTVHTPVLHRFVHSATPSLFQTLSYTTSTPPHHHRYDHPHKPFHPSAPPNIFYIKTSKLVDEMRKLTFNVVHDAVVIWFRGLCSVERWRGYRRRPRQ